MMRFSARRIAALLGTAPLLVNMVHAQTGTAFPAKPVRIVVPFPAGRQNFCIPRLAWAV